MFQSEMAREVATGSTGLTGWDRFQSAVAPLLKFRYHDGGTS
jgi:hypothetical protein